MSFIVPTNFRQLPPVWEMSQPFQIDNNGTVGYDIDPVIWARNHILAVCLTDPGERVMRPNYGAGLHRYVWENQDPLAQQEMLNAIQQAVAAWEPNVLLEELEFVPQPDFSGVVDLRISFSIGSAPTVHTVSFSLGGVGVEVTA